MITVYLAITFGTNGFSVIYNHDLSALMSSLSGGYYTSYILYRFQRKGDSDTIIEVARKDVN